SRRSSPAADATRPHRELLKATSPPASPPASAPAPTVVRNWRRPISRFSLITFSPRVRVLPSPRRLRRGKGGSTGCRLQRLAGRAGKRRGVATLPLSCPGEAHVVFAQRQPGEVLSGKGKQGLQGVV